MKPINRVYIIRHGQVNGYENFPVYGHMDVDLTETGKLQMQEMAERLRLVEIKAIYSSDLKRTATGARLIARYHGAPLHFLPDLREMYFGDWEGMTLAEIRNRFPEELQNRMSDLVNYQAPGEGETISRFSQRITNCFERILAEQGEGDIVIMGHGGVNRILLCKALGLDFTGMFNIQQDYGCLNIIDYFKDSTLVRLVNG